MPSWVTLIIDQDELELNPPGGGQFQSPPVEKLAETHDALVAKGRASLEKTTEDL